MRRSGRKEVTKIGFEGVATDGGFVFKATVFTPKIGDNWTETAVKATAFADGVMEIAIDYTESISKVAEVVSGLFSKKSNFTNLDSIILNYRNIRLQVGRNTGRKNIICMLMKAMSMPDYKKCNNDVSVDTQTCKKRIPLKASYWLNHKIYTNSFYLDSMFKWDKSLWFKNLSTKKSIIISSVKDGIVTIESQTGEFVSDFVAELRKFFVPYSNFYGVKALEVEFNQFSIRVDEHNANRILRLYHRSWNMLCNLEEKELQEYYMAKHGKKLSDI